jgi:hypothetical protein
MIKLMAILNLIDKATKKVATAVFKMCFEQYASGPRWYLRDWAKNTVHLSALGLLIVVDKFVFNFNPLVIISTLALYFVWPVFLDRVFQCGPTDGVVGVIIITILMGVMAFVIATLSTSKSEIVKYPAEHIVRTDSKIIIINDLQTVESSRIYDYNMKSPKICKQMNWDYYGQRNADTYSICE